MRFGGLGWKENKWDNRKGKRHFTLIRHVWQPGLSAGLAVGKWATLMGGVVRNGLRPAFCF